MATLYYYYYARLRQLCRHTVQMAYIDEVRTSMHVDEDVGLIYISASPHGMSKSYIMFLKRTHSLEYLCLFLHFLSLSLLFGRNKCMHYVHDENSPLLHFDY